MNKKFLGLLEGFSENDWHMFGRFLESPFFVNARNYKKLFNVIKGNRNDFSKLTPAYINKLLDEDVHISTLNTRFSELYKLALKYLYHADAEKYPLEYHTVLFKSMTERNLFSNAVSVYTQSEDMLKPKSIYDYTNYINLVYAAGNASRKLNKIDNFFRQFAKYRDYSTVFSLYSIISNAYDSYTLDHEAIKQDRDKYIALYKLLNMKEIVNLFGHDPLYIPVIQLHLIVQAFLEGTDDTNYKKAFKYFDENFKKFNEDQISETYLRFQSICVLRVQGGNKGYYFHYFNIIKHKIKNNIPVITENIHYGFSEFHDVVNVALVCGEYEWTEKFVNDFADKLHPEIREGAVICALAGLYTEKKDFRKVYDLLSGYKKSRNKFVDSEIFIFKAVACFELLNFDEFERLLANLARLSEKHSALNPYFFERVNLFTLYSGKLAKQFNKPKKKIHEFIFELEKQNEYFHQKNWIKRKAEEILKGMI